MSLVRFDQGARWAAPVLVLVLLLAHAAPALSADRLVDPDDQITFTKEVARILQENCQLCHRPGSIGPMSLMTYEEVRPWTPMIRDAVLSQRMPPYHYETDVGIQELKYDTRLSEEDIRTLVAWIDAGAPQGDPADMPPPRSWPDPAQFRLAVTLGEPDVIVRSAPYSVPSVGQDIWWQPLVETGITEDRCIRAIETKASLNGWTVTHHANSTFLVGGAQAGRLSEYALGKLGEIVPDGACRVLPANSQVRWTIHYFPNGKEVVDDVVEIGLWLHPPDYEPEYQQTLALYNLQGGAHGRGYEIPPHGTLMTQGFHAWDTPVRIDSFQPHGHLRLTAMSLQVLRQNGRLEMVSMVSNWSPNWHLSHIYQDHVAPLLDVGDKLVITGWYDNTANNPYNPDPDQWVGIGDRTADEMSHAWLAVTHLDEEGYRKLLEQRPRPQQQPGLAGFGGGGGAPNQD